MSGHVSEPQLGLNSKLVLQNHIEGLVEVPEANIDNSPQPVFSQGLEFELDYELYLDQVLTLVVDSLKSIDGMDRKLFDPIDDLHKAREDPWHS